jgi:hypothetical protein
MGRGIMQHNKTKTFLTRGIFGPIFRPILYSRIDMINYSFLEVITATIKSIDKNIPSKNKMALQVWFSIAPKQHFELLFLPENTDDALIPVLKYAEINSGKECAYLTQGFILYNFEQLLINSTEFKEKIKMNDAELADTCNLIFGEGSQACKYLNYFKTSFNNPSIDPRDIPIIYVYEVAKLFIKNPVKQELALQTWDDDLIGKFRFINGFIEFLSNQKANSLIMIN